jgi:hypothetical protein
MRYTHDEPTGLVTTSEWRRLLTFSLTRHPRMKIKVYNRLSIANRNEQTQLQAVI